MNQNIKKVFITGASGGIGNAICEKFYQNSYSLVLISSSEEKLEILKNKFGSENYYYKCDLSDTKSITAIMEDVSNTHNDISVIVNKHILMLLIFPIFPIPPISWRWANGGLGSYAGA